MMTYASGRTENTDNNLTDQEQAEPPVTRQIALWYALLRLIGFYPVYQNVRGHTLITFALRIWSAFVLSWVILNILLQFTCYWETPVSNIEGLIHHLARHSLSRLNDVMGPAGILWALLHSKKFLCCVDAVYKSYARNADRQKSRVLRLCLAFWAFGYVANSYIEFAGLTKPERSANESFFGSSLSPPSCIFPVVDETIVDIFSRLVDWGTLLYYQTFVLTCWFTGTCFKRIADVLEAVLEGDPEQWDQRLKSVLEGHRTLRDALKEFDSHSWVALLAFYVYTVLWLVDDIADLKSGREITLFDWVFLGIICFHLLVVISVVIYLYEMVISDPKVFPNFVTVSGFVFATGKAAHYGTFLSEF